MKTSHQELVLRVSVAAVRGALLALVLAQAARADEGEASVRELTTPTKTIEAGAEWVSRDSFKFGEYNGLQNKGFYGIGNLDLRGGGAYDSADTTRWRLSGRNLGTDARDVKGEYGWQGRFRLNFGYDELLRNDDDRYQTPYLGAGGTHLTLPGNWSTPAYRTGVALGGSGAAQTYPGLSATMLGLNATGYGSPFVTNSVYVCRLTSGSGCAINSALPGTLGKIYTTSGLPGNAQNTAMLNNNLTDLNDFHFVDLSTKRQKYDAGASYDIDARMNVAVSYRREKKDGLKQMGVVNSDGGPSIGGVGSLAGENSVIFPKVIDTVTDQYNASFNFTDKKGFFTAAYYGSVFTNNVKAMTIANPWGNALTVPNVNGVGTTTFPAAFGVSSATISEEPDNTLHQFKLAGGYNLTPGTKAVLDASYSRNAQNDPFVLDPGMYSAATGAAAGVTSARTNGSYTPVSSANALVVDKAFDFKLTSQPVHRVNLTADYKYDNRENQTPVNTYVWYDAGAKNFTNTALSPLNGATVPGIPATTAVPTAQSFNLYSGANVVANRPYSKKLNQGDLDLNFNVAPGQALRFGYQYQAIDRYCNGTWTDCSFADRSKENTLKTELRFTATETVTGRIGADWGSRSVTYNPNAWMALAPALSATNIPGFVSQGYSGSVLGFLNTYGLTPYGPPIAANAANPIGAIAASPQLTAIYNALFGTGNGGLSNNYYANHNTTQNWSGLDVYNMANRDRARVRGNVNWQPTDAVALQAGFDYRHDHYPSNQFGLENNTAWSANFDGAFTPSEDLALDAYYTHEDQKTQSGGNPNTNGTVNHVSATALGTPYSVVGGGTGVNSAVAGLCAGDSTAGLGANFTQFQVYNNNLKIDPCAQWGANMRDRTDTIGLAFSKKRLVWSRFSLSGDASYSRSLTTNDMTGGFYYANTLAPYAANVPAVFFINAMRLPEVTTSISHFGLTGRYQLSKSGTVRMSYGINWLHTDDYVYRTTTPAGTSSSVMPTMDNAQNYVVHVVGVSYAYVFQ